MRQTKRLMQVAAAMMTNPMGRHFGYELLTEAGVSSGVLYPMLSKFLEQGWVTADWQENPKEGRPPRRYYRLTDLGRRELGAIAAAAPAPQGKQRPARGLRQLGTAFNAVEGRWAW